jgi:hypothetical protein
MEALKRSPGYVEGQIRALIAELGKASATHNAKLSAVKKFCDYINKYRPEAYDDDVDYLYRGTYEDGTAGLGLLYWSGLASSKHGGQLKRICAPIISLLRFLVRLQTDSGADNMFYLRFVQLGVAELKKINFRKHILIPDPKSSTGSSRSGNRNEACELLYVLESDHRNAYGDHESLDIDLLIEGDSACRDKYEAWKDRFANEVVDKNQLAYQDSGEYSKNVRPVTWDAVMANYKPVPLQEGEEGEIEVDDVIEEDPACPDPLGVKETDLRAVQSTYLASYRDSKLKKKVLQRIPSLERNRGRNSSLWSRDERSSRHTSMDSADAGGRRDGPPLPNHEDMYRHSDSREPSRRRLVQRFDDGDDEDSEDDYDRYSDVSGAGGGPGPTDGKKGEMQSVIPRDKNFSIGLFLAMVHGDTTFEELSSGLDQLKIQVEQRSRERERLVR